MTSILSNLLLRKPKLLEDKNDRSQARQGRELTQHAETILQLLSTPRCFFFLLVLCLLSFSLLMRRKVLVEKTKFMLIAKLLTDSDQSKEGSFGWYQEQLENNLLGKTKFKDSIISRFGFQDEATTSKDMFYYFRTFSPKTECPKQSSCEIYAKKPAGDYLKQGSNLDAVLVHYDYKDPFFLSSLKEQTRNIDILHALQSEKLRNTFYSNIDYSNMIDEIYGEKMWRGMRRLSLFMCSEAVMAEKVKLLAQRRDDLESMERFSKSTADISICFLRTCSVWVNYLYYPIEFVKTGMIGSKPLTPYKGLCAFISNCRSGGNAQQRSIILQQLSKYIHVTQYGACGRNAKEDPRGKQYEIENNCRFYFAGENSVVSDYITEKFFEGLKAIENGAKMLMIYKGAPNIGDWKFPKSTFINIDDFESVDKLGEYLSKLQDDEEFEKRFEQIQNDKSEIDNVIKKFNHRLGSNIPCRICKSIGQTKLARYLLFKIGLIPRHNKVNYMEWEAFRNQFEDHFDSKRLQILDQIYNTAYGIFQVENNFQNQYNRGWKF